MLNDRSKSLKILYKKCRPNSGVRDLLCTKLASPENPILGGGLAVKPLNYVRWPNTWHCQFIRKI